MGTLDPYFDITADPVAPVPGSEPEYDKGPKAFLLGFERQNYITESITSEDGPQFKPEDGYNPLDDEDNVGYDPMQIYSSRSPTESRYYRTQLDNERRKRDVIDSHWTGLVGEVAGSLMRPEIIATGLSGMSWKGIFAVDSAAEIGSEAYLHHKQKLRTAQESLINIGAVAIGTAIMGTAATLYNKGKAKPPVWKSDKPEVDDLGAGDNLSGSAGSARSTGSPAEYDRLIGGRAAEITGIGPAVRMTSSPDPQARQLAGELIDQSAYTKGMEKGETKGVTVEAEAHQRMGEVVSVMDNFKGLQKQFVKDAGQHMLNFRGKWRIARDFDEQVGIALSNGGKHANKHVVDAAADIRARILEPRKQELIDSGMELKKTKYASDYFPRIYDRHKIVKNYSQLKDLLVKRYSDDLTKSRKVESSSTSAAKGVKAVQAAAAKATREQRRVSQEVAAEADTMARHTIQNMLGGLPAGHGISSINKRTLALTDTQLKPFLEKRASVVMAKYTSAMDPYLIMQNRYGDEMLTDKFKAIELNFDKMIDAAADGKATATLKKRKENDMKDLTAMRDRILNRVQRSVDPASTVEKVIQFVKTYNIATQLMGITLTSLPDVARPIMAYGMRSYAVGLAKGMTNYTKSLAGVSDVAAKRMGVAAQRTLNSRMMEMADLGEPTTPITAAMQHAWSKLTMFDHWTDLMESITAQTSMDWTLRVAKKASAGKPLSRSETMKIARMGFTDEDLKKFYAASGKTSGGGLDDSVLKFADTLEWGDSQLARHFEAGIGSDVRRAIIRVGHGDKPLLMDQTWASLMLQYKSFAIAATNRMLLAGLQQRDFAMASGIMSSIFLGAVVEATKGRLRGQTADKSPTEWVRAGIDRTGMLGLYNIPFNMARAVAFEDSPSRYAHRNVGGIIAGSTVSQLERAGKMLVSAGEGDMEAVAEQGKFMIPYANAMHMRDVMLQLGEN